MAEKMTKKEMFTAIANILSEYHGEDENTQKYVDFLAHEVELLENRKSGSKSSPVKTANEGLMRTIKTVLGERETPATVTELMEDVRLQSYTITKSDNTSTTEVITNQKLSALLKKLVDSGDVQKEMIKKKTYFSLSTELDN